jgi:hypothetical protein
MAMGILDTIHTFAFDRSKILKLVENYFPIRQSSKIDVSASMWHDDFSRVSSPIVTWNVVSYESDYIAQNFENNQKHD